MRGTSEISGAAKPSSDLLLLFLLPLVFWVAAVYIPNRANAPAAAIKASTRSGQIWASTQCS